MVDWDRFSVMRHFVGNANLGICAIRINRDDLVTVLATDQIMDKTLLSSKDNANVFPLYLYSDELGKTFAQATPEEKNSVSHRGRALHAMLEKLNSQK